MFDIHKSIRWASAAIIAFTRQTDGIYVVGIIKINSVIAHFCDFLSCTVQSPCQGEENKMPAMTDTNKLFMSRWLSDKILALETNGLRQETLAQASDR